MRVLQKNSMHKVVDAARASTPLKNSRFSLAKKNSSFNNLISKNQYPMKPIALSSFGSASRATEFSSGLKSKEYSPYIQKE